MGNNRSLGQIEAILIDAGFNVSLVTSMSDSELITADMIDDWDVLNDYMDGLAHLY